MSQLKMTQTYIYKWKNLPRPIARRQKQVAKQYMSTQSCFAKNILIYRIENSIWRNVHQTLKSDSL